MLQCLTSVIAGQNILSYLDADSDSPKKKYQLSWCKSIADDADDDDDDDDGADEADDADEADADDDERFSPMAKEWSHQL